MKEQSLQVTHDSVKDYFIHMLLDHGFVKLEDGRQLYEGSFSELKALCQQLILIEQDIAL
ncbi:hypothetical protein Q73_02825 [Bacillus coahuilensis m2-6]|uniref:Fur-regulated basic protein FbpA n=1 Tax=Bacillus coahuilensis p1.1.43 TaxID=1150625 RepID=A0A147KB46_9BACI|nr:Fur-regulated basic protein FbpA [Bacillus coahuilensis]KUP08114.1 hypothetical protein Q75_03390 [Bacillus coahuilensis p1.1.43]KUP09563.1 hypothetical protein Q73_02825 [Bacillus coahuilensis m2-6]